MKINKVICLDEDIIEFLKGKNASATINTLLKDRMEDEDFNNMSEKELELELKAQKLEQKMTKKVQKIRQNG